MPRLFFLLLIYGSTAAGSAAQLRTVALTGEQVPGAPDGVVFDSFSFNPQLNNSGETAFIAKVQGVGVTTSNDVGVLSEGSGALSLVAREGDPAPGTPNGAHFRSILQRLQFNDAGEVALLGNSQEGNLSSTISRGIWAENAGTLSLVARSGEQAPDMPSGRILDDISFLPSFNNAAQVTFATTYNCCQGGGSGVWSGASGDVSLVAQSEDQAPGLPPGAQFGSFSWSESSLPSNDIGQTVFLNILRHSGSVTDQNDMGIWLGSSGDLSLVAREGDPAPNTSPGVVFDDMRTPFDPTLNNAGETAFYARLVQGVGGVDSSNDEGIWHGLPGAITLAVREGEQAPGTPAGSRFGELEGPVLNGGGDIVFEAALQQGMGGVDSTNDSGIWLLSGGTLDLVMREGGQAPDAALGAEFETFRRVVLNAAGHVAVFGQLRTGTGDVLPFNQLGIWAQDADGDLQKIARQREFLEVAPGDKRLISSLGFHSASGNEDGRPSAFNDDGQITFRATFRNGTEGIFVASGTVSFVPEPSLLALLLVSLVGARLRFISRAAHPGTRGD